jgi:predicted peptidase
MRSKILLLLFYSFTVASLAAQDLSLYQKKWLIEKGDTLPYRLLLPENFDTSKRYPLILFLHGAGERGRDNESQLVHGAKFFLQDNVRDSFPAIVVFPQCMQESYWSNVKQVKDEMGKRKFDFEEKGSPSTAMALVQMLMKNIQNSYRIDKDRIYVGGLSMGGMGTFEIVRRNPRMFAAAFPICGGGNPTTAKKIKRTAWWVFHGAKDDVVPHEYSQEMVTALIKRGASVKFTLYPEVNHNSWDPAFAEKDLLGWLFSHHK